MVGVVVGAVMFILCAIFRCVYAALPSYTEREHVCDPVFHYTEHACVGWSVFEFESVCVRVLYMLVFRVFPVERMR